MIRLTLFFILIFCSSLTTSGQRTCGSDNHMDKLMENPKLKAAWELRQKKFEKENQNQIANKGMLCPNPVILPVAVHFQGVSSPNLACLTNLAEDQIRVLNEDYQGSNADISNWNNNDAQYFPGISNGETCIQFCLASSNHPSGYGLVEGQPAVTINTTSGDFNSAFSGYINIYVRNINFLGYSPLGGSGNGDGVVIDDQAFGSNSVSGCGTVTPGAPYNLGRTLTHELGHYLNLGHIWGNGCNVDDGVGDTPDSSNEYYGCPNIPSSSCGTNDMLMNYMDYTNDACMYMFSAGQSTRMENYTNANLQNVINKAATVCNTQPQPPVSNFAADQTAGCGDVINFTDLSSGSATSWMWNFGDGNTSTQQNPAHTYTAAGTYTVSLTVTNSAGSNTSTKTNYITIILPTATGGSFCAPGTATLTATFPGGDLNWYDGNGNFLATGTTYTTPVLNNTTTYYVEGSQGSTQNVGPVNGNFGGGGIHNASAQYLLFTVLNEFTLESAWVSSNQAGNRTIELRNGSGALISSQTINIPNGDSRITLNLNLTPGTYQIGGDNMNLFRNNSNPSYPYTIPSLVEITGSTAGPDYYYYLYDWEVSTGCTSAQIPVVATSSGLQPTSTFTTSISGSTVTFTNTSSNSTIWLWDFGDGTTSTLENPTHTYANNGNYVVTLQSSSSCGSQTSNQTVAINSVPLLNVNLTAILEGAYNQGAGMTTDLRQLDLFPLTGQPYTVAPWNYMGTEGVGWTPSDYPVNTVDWVLVSVRSGEAANTTVGQAAGLLFSDGTVSVDIQLSSVLPSYYVVLEHRNHLPVMSPMLLPVVNNEITYDFSAADSYTSGIGFGQKNIGSDWMLYGGNGDQGSALGHEITGADIIQWNLDNGLFDIYSQSDFNLNGDVNANDKILWSINNGIFSEVPR